MGPAVWSKSRVFADCCSTHTYARNRCYRYNLPAALTLVALHRKAAWEVTGLEPRPSEFDNC
jgi:hypothetical protein